MKHASYDANLVHSLGNCAPYSRRNYDTKRRISGPILGAESGLEVPVFGAIWNRLPQFPIRLPVCNTQIQHFGISGPAPLNGSLVRGFVEPMGRV